jgi:hypothetical protein
METMRKFKVGDEIVRVSVDTSWAHIGYKATVLENYEYLCKDGEYTPINDGQWELVKPKWTIYNNDKAWQDLSDKQKGKLLLAAHAKIIFTCNELDVYGDVQFNNEGAIYKAIKPEPVKPKPTMAELFMADVSECNTGLLKHIPEPMIAKGWTKSC